MHYARYRSTRERVVVLPKKENSRVLPLKGAEEFGEHSEGERD